jgi:poly-gamma-glutamate system protein
MNKKILMSSFAPIYAAGLLSLLFIAATAFLATRATGLRGEMIEASRLMARAEDALRNCRALKGVAIDPGTDPNRTGLVGLETSPTTTSLGNLEAKRTTANPNFAGLLVDLFEQAGLKKNDAVAVGASGSFPALIIATLTAARVAGLRPLMISSLGASDWGANNADFNWLDMEGCLQGAGLLDVASIAVAVGGAEDIGRDMSPEGREALKTRILESGIPFLDEPDLETNVATRLLIYEKAAAGRPIRAFVNIGGSWANIGTNAEILKLRPGLSRQAFVPPPGERGVLQAMAAKGIPIIHLLNVRGLCERYGLPWDPKPLPGPGEGALYGRATARGRSSSWRPRSISSSSSALSSGASRTAVSPAGSRFSRRMEYNIRAGDFGLGRSGRAFKGRDVP